MDVYERLDILGRGSYGTAFLVRPRGSTEQLRVLKEVDLSRLSEDKRTEAWQEVDVLKSLQHTNIIAYHATFVETGRLYIVMEFADGGTLSQTINQRCRQAQRYSEDEVLLVFSQLCLALQHIHTKNILHRDVKSENVFLTKDGSVKLGDFGIAKVLESTRAEAVTLIGTPLYLAPEVCDSKPYGSKADIWSLGIILYEVLMFHRPFEATNLAALVVKIVTSKPKPIPEDAKELYSKELRRLAKKLLHKHPDKRPSANDILMMPAVSTKVQARAAFPLLSAHVEASAAGTCNSGITISASRSSSRSSCSRSSSCSIPQERQAAADEGVRVPRVDPLEAWYERLVGQDDVSDNPCAERSQSNRRCQSHLCRDEIAFDVGGSCTGRAGSRKGCNGPRSKSRSHSKLSLPRLDARPPGVLSKLAASDDHEAHSGPAVAVELGMQRILSCQLPRLPQDEGTHLALCGTPSSGTSSKRFSCRPPARAHEQHCRSRSRLGSAGAGEFISRSRSRPPTLESGSA